MGQHGAFYREIIRTSLSICLSQHAPGAILERLFVKISAPELFLLMCGGEQRLWAHLLRVLEGQMEGPVAVVSSPSLPFPFPHKSSNDPSGARQ